MWIMGEMRKCREKREEFSKKIKSKVAEEEKREAIETR